MVRTAFCPLIPYADMKRRGFFFKQRTDHLDPVLTGGEDRTARQIESRVLGVIASHCFQTVLGQSEHDAADARPINRARAHRAGLGRCVERALRKNFRRKFFGRPRREQSLGMRGHVAIRHESVLDFYQHLAVRTYQDGAERMVAV